jgi:hypothetical protein
MSQPQKTQPDQNQTPRADDLSLVTRTWQALAHTLGVLVVAAVMFVPLLNKPTLELMWASAAEHAFLEFTALEVLLHFALAGCLWTMIVLFWGVVRSRRQPVKTLLNLNRGNVMTETLVILPVFFLLTFGIAQLAINNMAAIVANTAVFQAGRTVWLWSSEAEANRRGVTFTKAREMARVQAAAVMTPVAPGDFVQDPGIGSGEFESMRAILLGSQIPFPSSDLGQVADSAVPLFFAFDSIDPASLSSLGGGSGMTSIPGKNSSYYRAFDSSGFRSRTVRKFTFAYACTHIQLIDHGDQVGARLVYLQQQAMPMVGRIFGDFSIVSLRPDYYARIEREFTMNKQIVPNPTVP